MKRSLPECIVCWDSPDGPILQCAEGHLICAACDKDLRERKCPTCRMDLGPLTRRIRSRVAEEAIAESMTSCEHCGESMTRGALALHQCPRFVNRLTKKTFGNRVEHYTGLQGEEVCSHTEFHEGDKHVRTEFYGAGGVHVRTEFPVGHSDHGEIHHIIGGKHVRTEFAVGHARHGEIGYWVDGKRVRIEYAPGHEYHGVIRYCVDGKQVRTERAPGHARHGEIAYFADGKHVRTEWPQLAAAANSAAVKGQKSQHADSDCAGGRPFSNWQKYEAARKALAEQSVHVTSVGPFVSQLEQAQLEEQEAKAKQAQIHPAHFKPGGLWDKYAPPPGGWGFAAAGFVLPDDLPKTHRKFGSFYNTHVHQFRATDAKKNLYM